jgi:hypothetical protein
MELAGKILTVPVFYVFHRKGGLLAPRHEYPIVAADIGLVIVVEPSTSNGCLLVADLFPAKEILSIRSNLALLCQKAREMIDERTNRRQALGFDFPDVAFHMACADIDVYQPCSLENDVEIIDGGSSEDKDSSEEDDSENESDEEIAENEDSKSYVENTTIRADDLDDLISGKKVGDEIINFYLEMIAERSRRNKNAPYCHCFNTFFYPLLVRGDGIYHFSKAKRIVEKIGALSCFDVLVIPIHSEKRQHWSVAIVDYRQNTVEYVDSMGYSGKKVLATIRRFGEDEAKFRGAPIGAMTEITRRDNPIQTNFVDCGIFMCKYVECVTRNAKPRFAQSDVPTIRQTMSREIKAGRLEIGWGTKNLR